MYQLSSQFKAHEADVKSIVSIDESTFSSCSRDGSVKTWFLDQEKQNKWDHVVVSQSTNKSYINSLCFVDGIIYESGSNKSIEGFPYLSNIQENENEPVFNLIKHTANVCELSSYHDPETGDVYIISSSWDSSAIVWKNNELLYTLSGHAATVWDSKIINATTFITCSADRTVKVWNENKCIKTFENLHSDVIRSIDIDLKASVFITTSNDSLIQICDLETGFIKNTLYGHTNFVYKVRLAKNNKLVSCGEDRTLRVWDLTKMAEEQCIVLPTVSVWCFAQLENEDLVIGSSDSMIRVFTKCQERSASDKEIQEFSEEIKNSTISAKTIEDKDISPYETILKPGNKEGQVVVVKSPQGSLEAHQYSNNAWSKVGDVVGAAGSENKVEYEGKKYDYVFDVDVEDGKPPLKLPYNANDNLYVIAENFLSKNDLPASYREEIVRFIISNTGGVAMDSNPAPPSNQTSQMKILPVADEYLSLNSFKKEQLLKGLQKLNTSEEVQIGEQYMCEFEKALEDPASNVDFLYAQAEFIKAHWTVKTPAYDLVRIIAAYLPSSSEIISYINEGLVSDDLTIHMLAVRSFVNCFSNSEWGIDLVSQSDLYHSALSLVRSDIPDSFRQASQLMIAVSTLLLNYSILIIKTKNADIVPNIADPLNNKFGATAKFLDNEEVAYRMLVSYGNLSVMEPSLKQFAQSIRWLKELKFKYENSGRFLDLFEDLNM